jgi:hypothetical protein
VGRRRKPSNPPIEQAPQPPDQPAPTPAPPGNLRAWLLTILAAIALLTLHYALAYASLRSENPTVDEVAHLPAGVTYWQKGTFRLYHHNPPLAKLVAALPVVLAGAITDPLYTLNSWASDSPSQATFGESFALYNAKNYFELFTRARGVMPIFSVIGGIFIFAWSSRLYGRLGGLLSLTLWCLCPNILAHARLVTSDVAGAAMGLAATFAFWHYLKRPAILGATVAGVALGLAELTKFSLLLLYAYWPLLWLARILFERDFVGFPRRLFRDTGHGLLIVAVSVFVIDLGYQFEKVGTKLGSFEFVSKSLTRPLTAAEASKPRPKSQNPLFDLGWKFRINRFRGTWLEGMPVPLPYHFLAGFDEQRIETEGMPAIWQNPDAGPNEKLGYSVYLDGTLRTGGWWYYYLACLAYKVPEGTWLVVLGSFVALAARKRSRAQWFDEFAVLAFPAIVLFAMTALTDINLGLRYVLPIFPFVYVAAGKVVPAIAAVRGVMRLVLAAGLVGCLGLTALQTALVHPSYLASFNWISGGPDRGSEHLIDSNLDWGQDLVGLKRWLAKYRPGQQIGLAYFGQINPNIFGMRNEEFPWFLAPVLPGSTLPMSRSPGLVGPAPRLQPGVYAVSASIVRGLPWRMYDPGGWQPGWNAWKLGAFGYFAELTPVANVGHSIFIYDVTEADCARINPRFEAVVAKPR